MKQFQVLKLELEHLEFDDSCRVFFFWLQETRNIINFNIVAVIWNSFFFAGCYKDALNLTNNIFFNTFIHFLHFHMKGYSRKRTNVQKNLLLYANCRLLSLCNERVIKLMDFEDFQWFAVGLLLSFKSESFL